MMEKMDAMNKLCVFIFAIIAYSTAKRSHPVPTYFGSLDSEGNIVDRASPNYNAEIESKPRSNKISREDAATIQLETWPAVVKNGEKVTVLWRGVINPQPKDYIAHYCPFYDDPKHYLDYRYVKDVAGWERGYGHFDIVVFNMRAPCIFKYYREANKTFTLAATSNKLNFADGGPYAPLHGHIAMTNKPSEMRVSWNSAELTQPPVVRYGTTKDLKMKENSHITHTYTKDSMCQSPANGDGFWHPGYIYDVLLTNLTPKTLYYYAYGTDDLMSNVANFTTPLPKGNTTPYKFVIYGDMGVDPSPEAYATAKYVRREVSENDIRFVFHHGDISYARGYAYIWEQWFWLTEPYATLVPYMVGVGNHEYDHSAGGLGRDPSNIATDHGWKPDWFNGWTDSGGECAVPMHKRYHMPENGNSLFWYSYDYGLIHMIMMSTEHDYSPGSDQYVWLENDLKKVDRKATPWVFIGGHRAMYCSEKEHGDFVVATHMQTLFEDLLFKYKVDIAFWAHYHSYERTCAVYKNKCVKDGVVHIVVGSAGKSRDIDEWYPEPWSKFRISAYGYGRVSVANSTELLYEWVANSDGKVKDGVWLHKN